jgi:hypothetical protein
MTYTPTTIFGARLAGKLAPWLTDDLSRYADAIAVMFDPVLELVEEEGTDGEPGYVPTWGKLLDPSARPYPNDEAKEITRLAFLGQFVGATIPIGASESEARALVKAESGLERGTRASIESAIERSVSSFWTPLTAYVAGQLLRHEAVPGELLTYKVVTSFTSGATFATTHLELVSIKAQYDLIEREKPGGEEAAYHFTIVTKPEQLTPEGNTAQLEANVNTVKPAGLIGHYVQSDEVLIDEGTIDIEEGVGEISIEAVVLANIT